MRIKRMGRFLRIVTFGWPRAITLAPFGIYIKDECFNDPIIRNHERITEAQQMEMLILPFYLWYFIELLIRIIVNGKQCYMKMWFEIEAHDNDNNLDYLTTRKHFAWL